MTTTTLTPMNPWAPPRLSWRWWPVFLRNLLVWRKLALPSVVANIAEPLIWLVAFGYGLGALGPLTLGLLSDLTHSFVPGLWVLPAGNNSDAVSEFLGLAAIGGPQTVRQRLIK